MSQPQSRIPTLPSDQQLLKPCRRRFTESFKRDTVRLVPHEGYTFKTAATAVGVSEKSLREWHKKLAPVPTPGGPDASVEQLQDEVRQLRQQLKQAEMERAIFKKVSHERWLTSGDENG